MTQGSDQTVTPARRTIDTGERTGWRTCHAQCIGYFADGLPGLGRLVAARKIIELAIMRAEQSGEVVFHAELNRCRFRFPIAVWP